jgi:hypothetical protein
MSLVVALIMLILVAPVVANDEPDELVPGRITVVKTATTFKFTGKPTTGVLDLPNPSNDPTVEGGTLVVSDTGGAAGTASFPLPSGAGWRRLPADTSRPLRGYRYNGAGTPTDPCRVVLVRETVVKATCKGSGVTLTTPFSGDVAIVLTIGTDSKRYCATFGGTTLNNTETITRRKNAPPPAFCGGGSVACACGDTTPQVVTFTNGVGSGTCGSITGGTINNIACGGLYFGGGLDAVPLPIVVPDFAQPLTFGVDSCNGSTLNVTATTQTDTGSSRTCTSAGCFFGPPLPVPNPLSTPTSTCLYNVAAQDATGTLACDTGAASLSLRLATGVFLTGDLLANRCQGGSNPGGRCTVSTQAVDCPGGTCQPDNDIQPCPICNPVTNICNGGMDNGMACTPGSTQSVTGQFPTSHDCRVSTLVKLGDLDVPLDLTTGTDSDTAVPSGTQQRVFCGFCRDADGTGAFQGPPALACESNAGCAQPFEACEQRSQGAFANGAATMLTTTGSPGGSLADFGSHATTLVSVFCIPPVYNGIIDGQADLPGPGAITLSGSIQISGTP